jgi:hypothetical protein
VTYQLIIKGGPVAAERYAWERGFTLIRLQEALNDTTVLRVALDADRWPAADAELALAQWFTEGPHHPPYPTGALLHYSIRGD